MMKKKITAVALLCMIFLSGVFSRPVSTYAAGWLDYAKELTFGQAVAASVKSGDFYSGWHYWHVYKFTMPADGLLSIYMESKSSAYKYTYLDIYSVSDVENVIWETRTGSGYYSSARAIYYYADTEISLDRGEYYFVCRPENAINTPYYLTLDYREPYINMASITLDKTKLTLQPGEQSMLNVGISPANATDKTVIWRTTNPAVAVVDNGVVTAVSTGYASIIASSADGEVSAVCSVTVTEPAAVVEVQGASTRITKLSAGKKKASVRFSPIKISGIRYQVSYKKEKGKWKTKNCAKTSMTLKNLSPKKTYTVRVRGYKNVNGRTCYSRWSVSKTVRIKG